jgi:hypothetical protein
MVAGVPYAEALGGRDAAAVIADTPGRLARAVEMMAWHDLHHLKGFEAGA